jgi:hypothetical protein
MLIRNMVKPKATIGNRNDSSDLKIEVRMMRCAKVVAIGRPNVGMNIKKSKGRMVRINPMPEKVADLHLREEEWRTEKNLGERKSLMDLKEAQKGVGRINQIPRKKEMVIAAKKADRDNGKKY